ncbi:hypothetical protein GOP47_0021427 [Adiantum capillus-veneris]|uniref:Uncharacterized protein n=1 Tax=Adiantum capillus-veneris TaxID=13818 RepID=A0A9D4U840_ADICA|nr:hypothetical protein GOP47_0021427 [Adiantum capillus-veneris]
MKHGKSSFHTFDYLSTAHSSIYFPAQLLLLPGFILMQSCSRALDLVGVCYACPQRVDSYYFGNASAVLYHDGSLEKKNQACTKEKEAKSHCPCLQSNDLLCELVALPSSLLFYGFDLQSFPNILKDLADLNLPPCYQ